MYFRSTIAAAMAAVCASMDICSVEDYREIAQRSPDDLIEAGSGRGDEWVLFNLVNLTRANGMDCHESMLRNLRTRVDVDCFGSRSPVAVNDRISCRIIQGGMAAGFVKPSHSAGACAMGGLDGETGGIQGISNFPLVQCNSSPHRVVPDTAENCFASGVSVVQGVPSVQSNACGLCIEEGLRRHRASESCSSVCTHSRELCTTFRQLELLTITAGCIAGPAPDDSSVEPRGLIRHHHHSASDF